MIADECPDCGVVRLPWLGSSHFKVRYVDREPVNLPACSKEGCAAQLPEEFFAAWVPPAW